LDGALSTLGWWEMSLLMAGGLEPADLQGPSPPNPFRDSMKKPLLPTQGDVKKRNPGTTRGPPQTPRERAAGGSQRRSPEPRRCPPVGPVASPAANWGGLRAASSRTGPGRDTPACYWGVFWFQGYWLVT